MNSPVTAVTGLFTQGIVNHESYRRKNGEWVTPAEVKVEAVGTTRRATLLATGEEIEIGPPTKMSKSLKNVVDPDDIIKEYGADTARWFVLSDSPPDRTTVWTEEGVQGAARFVQRLWRLVCEAAAIAAPLGTTPPAAYGAAALALRKAAHGALSRVTDDLEKLRFNVYIAHIYEFANALQEALASVEDDSGIPADLASAVREAADILVVIFHPLMPHLAEECWATLGHRTLVAEAAWPEVEAALLVEDTITLPVQVNGKKRAEVTVARDAKNTDIEGAVLGLEAVQRALDGKRPKKVIVVPHRIVNVVA